MRRLTLLRTLAILFALALWFAALGLVDIVTPWFLDERTAVHDLGYGAVTGLLVPAGLLAQVRNPEHWLAGLQQVAACAIAYLVAGAIADPGFLALGALVAGGLVLLLVV